METDLFIDAFRRFVSRRGPVRQLRSDQGTNFIGAKRELQQALAEMDQGKIRAELRLVRLQVQRPLREPYGRHMGKTD